jgi:hypothetical protein
MHAMDISAAEAKWIEIGFKSGYSRIEHEEIQQWWGNPEEMAVSFLQNEFSVNQYYIHFPRLDSSD